ncbi:hypothetical protein RHMOL_Rhmol07G0044400 [Rhododendron molle]|uniref:Uncharacterized protein n=1 Tax=Rhododendron molle TaxID=49168 RepID=A0ACC0MYY6_RHOML|nr:hypothetical protein RHMOL_Rhmol07G0044400 [Rhododendron molle]
MAMAMAAVLLLFFLVAPTVHSLQYNVTWNLKINYNAWAAGKTFTIGDTLVFTYTTEHAVDVVDQTEYASCNSWNALYSYTGGQTAISLATPGPMYFLCPIQGHCQAGMKLGITVVAVAAAASPTAPTTTPTPTSTTTPTTPKPPASPTTRTTPPPTSTTTPKPQPPASTTTPTSTPSPSPSFSPSPTVTSPSGSPSSGPSPKTSTSPVITAAASSPKSSSGAGGMIGNMGSLVAICNCFPPLGFPSLGGEASPPPPGRFFPSLLFLSPLSLICFFLLPLLALAAALSFRFSELSSHRLGSSPGLTLLLPNGVVVLLVAVVALGVGLVYAWRLFAVGVEVLLSGLGFVFFCRFWLLVADGGFMVAAVAVRVQRCCGDDGVLGGFRAEMGWRAVMYLGRRLVEARRRLSDKAVLVPRVSGNDVVAARPCTDDRGDRDGQWQLAVDTAAIGVSVDGGSLIERLASGRFRSLTIHDSWDEKIGAVPVAQVIELPLRSGRRLSIKIVHSSL